MTHVKSKIVPGILIVLFVLSFVFCRKMFRKYLSARAARKKECACTCVLLGAVLLHAVVNERHTDKVARVHQKLRGEGRRGETLLVNSLLRWVFVFEGMSSDCNYCAC